jgi:hypothetical protein
MAARFDNALCLVYYIFLEEEESLSLLNEAARIAEDMS